MEYTVENLCGFLIRSRLLSPDEVRGVRDRWARSGGAADGPASPFTRWLVANGYVTEYQATRLARGQADDFFLNDYKVLERIGRGRMAGVYRAAHPSGQVVAIKVLPPSRAKDPQYFGRFQREARLSLKLRHPNIVRAFQLGECRGLHYFVMECLDGETLDDVLQRRKQLPPGEAVRIVHQVLLGLQHLHEQGMVHRDLKPANLMLTPPPSQEPGGTTLHSTVKILDVGLARELYDDAPPTPTAETADGELTMEGVLLGTPDYLAPEQARDPRRIDVRADIYSLGCVLYHLLAGQPPFPDKNLLTQMVRHATEPPRPVRELNPAVPEGLEQILSWMMAKAPDQRYPTPLRAAQALQVFLLSGDRPATSDEASVEMRRYLSWLETTGEPAEKPANTSLSPEPAAAPSPPPVAPEKPPAEVSPGRQATPLPPTLAREPKRKAPDRTPAPPTPPTATFPLNRRDLVMLGIGAAVGVLSCAFLGGLVFLISLITG